MATTQGGAKITMLAQVAGTKPTFTAYAPSDGTEISGYVNPELSSESVRMTADIQRTINYQGDIVATHASGRYYECTFQLIPFGTTGANAKLSARFFLPQTTFVIIGLPVIPCPDFPSVSVTAGGLLNVDNASVAGSERRWIFEGDQSISLSNNADATMSITLRRYPLITGGTAISS